jgi:hypothetical protein
MTITAVNGHTSATESMVGRTIEGQQVVADDFCETGLSTPERPVHFKRIRKLTLSDGTVVHKCTECDYVRPRWEQVRPHLSKHAEPKVEALIPGVSLMEMSLGELVEVAKRFEFQGRHIDRLIEERDNWKTRAQDAERRLAAMRRALNPN